MKTNRVVKTENRGDWVKVFYKIPKGRKVYSLFVEKVAVRGNKIENFFFTGEIRGKL
jgi:hypothetical protein